MRNLLSILLIMVACSGFGQTQPSAEYHFNGNSNDAMGLNNGTDHTISYVQGIENSAASFNGSGWVSITGTPTEFNLSGAMTIAAWLNTTTVAAGMKCWISSADNSSQQQYELELNRTAGKITIVWGNAIVATSTGSLTANTWYDVVVTRSGSSGNWTCNIYINGVLDKSTTSISTNPSSIQTVTIGTAGGGGGKWNGMIDGLKIYKAAMSVAEIKNRYGFGTGKMFH